MSLLLGSCFDYIPDLENDSIDLVLTDFPYGIEFMGKSWDSCEEGFFYKTGKALLPKMKAGSFLVTTFTPRMDMLWRCLSELEKAGFEMKTSPLFWLYHTGFPKASDISKGIDKRKKTLKKNNEFAEYIKAERKKKGFSKSELDKIVCNGSTMYSWFEGREGVYYLPSKKHYLKLKEVLKLDGFWDDYIEEAEREIVGKSKTTIGVGCSSERMGGEHNITKPINETSKAWSGFKSFQLKPSVEVIIAVQKPRVEKTIVGQVLANGCGAVNVEGCRIPFSNGNDKDKSKHNWKPDSDYAGDESVYELGTKKINTVQQQGRFPANLLVSGEPLVGEERQYSVTKGISSGKPRFFKEGNEPQIKTGYTDKGTPNRFYSLDAWWSKRNITLTEESAFFDVPKPSKAEKEKGLEGEAKQSRAVMFTKANNESGVVSEGFERFETKPKKNNHPTTKPVKLFTYLTELFSKKGDTVLDCFMGSGTTGIACSILGRKFVGIEKEKDYFEIAEARIKEQEKQTRLV